MIVTGLTVPNTLKIHKGKEPRVYSDGLNRKSRRPQMLKRKTQFEDYLLTLKKELEWK